MYIVILQAFVAIRGNCCSQITKQTSIRKPMVLKASFDLQANAVKNLDLQAKVVKRFDLQANAVKKLGFASQCCKKQASICKPMV
jgi:hypothetical protein